MMGFFDRLFGGSGRRSASGLPPDVEAVFEKIHRFMLDDGAQNRLCPPGVQQLMAAGGAVDEVAGATGEFGRDLRNPIPVNGVIGELVYLSAMALATDCHVMGHRLGSIDRTDVYETVALDGSAWDLLYLDPYHPRKSRRLPTGYRLGSASQAFLLATNYTVPTFPVGIKQAMRDCTARVLGMPLVSPQVRDDSLLQGFSRPPEHLRAVAALRLHGRTQSQG